jgi:hypothetical protein
MIVGRGGLEEVMIGAANGPGVELVEKLFGKEEVW